MNILILTDKKSIKDGKFKPEKFRKGIEHHSKKIVECRFSYYEDILITSRESNLEVVDTSDGENLCTYKVAYFKRADNLPEIAKSVALSLSKNNVRVIDTEHLDIASSNSGNKILEHVALNILEAKTPDSYLATLDSFKRLFAQNSQLLPEFPMVIKLAEGTRGSDNYLLTSKDDLRSINNHPNDFFVVQPFVENDCDYRLFVVGNKVKLVIKRTRNPKSKSHTNNTSTGASADLVGPETIDESIILEAERLSIEMKREVCGIDLIFDKNSGEYYFLEVNRSPQTETGSFVQEKMSELVSFLENM